LDPPPNACRLDAGAEPPTLHLAGDWRLANLAQRSFDLDSAGLPAHRGAVRRVEGSALRSIDTAAALLLWRRLARAGNDVATVELTGFEAGHARILALVRERLDAIGEQPVRRQRGLLGALGAAADDLVRLVHAHLSFLGLALASIAQALARPRLLRRRELFAQLSQTCLTAIPVVAVVTFLIGVVVAYLLGLQAAQYGANIFVVDGVALGMVREFSPLLVATIVAGRSGAAFTAQLGTMKLTEEIDAIRTLGLSAEQVLLVPRVLALVLALPLLVFAGSVFGLAGAAFVADLMLDITPHTFVDRVHDSLAVRHYLIGLGKAPVFALFIAVIGCSMGLTVSRDTRSIGINTTSTVVQSIVVVILLDALFAVLFQELGL
jgi:phospholipid/cholesterol/gamma-HCH transport system permease protein